MNQKESSLDLPHSEAFVSQVILVFHEEDERYPVAFSKWWRKEGEKLFYAWCASPVDESE